MNTLEISEAKILRGDIIEKLYGTYGVDIRIAALRNALRSKGLLPAGVNLAEGDITDVGVIIDE